jgi:hypothetical protein
VVEVGYGGGVGVESDVDGPAVRRQGDPECVAVRQRDDRVQLAQCGAVQGQRAVRYRDVGDDGVEEVTRAAPGQRRDDPLDRVGHQVRQEREGTGPAPGTARLVAVHGRGEGTQLGERVPLVYRQRAQVPGEHVAPVPFARSGAAADRDQRPYVEPVHRVRPVLEPPAQCPGDDGQQYVVGRRCVGRSVDQGTLDQ